MTLVVGDDFDASVALNTNARVCCTKINTNYGAVLGPLVLIGVDRNRT